MTYGSNKTRDISRSALRASRRAAKSARSNKRTVKQRARSRERDSISEFCKPGAPSSAVISEFEETAPILETEHVSDKREMRYVVRRRQDGDNLGTIMRWAEAVADDLGNDPQSRNKAMATILGPSLAGRHALGHVEVLAPYDTDPHSWRFRNAEIRAHREFSDACRYAEARKMYEIIAQFGLKRFNDHMRNDMVMENRRYARVEMRDTWIRREAGRMFRSQTGRWYSPYRVDPVDGTYSDRPIWAKCKAAAEAKCPPPLDSKLHGIHDIDRHMRIFGSVAVLDKKHLRYGQDIQYGSDSIQKLRDLFKIVVP